MNKAILSLSTLLMLASCKEQTQSIDRSSPTGKVHVNLHTSRYGIGNELKVKMTIQSGDIAPGSLSFEIGASKLDDKNLLLDWSGDSSCLVTFVQPDEEKRSFRIDATANSIEAYEVKGK
jgi:hypothetical protein